MSKAYEFLRECGAFFVLTNNGDFPAGRPFGAVMEEDGDLFIATNDMGQTHKQLLISGNMQIVAKKEGSREWIRITGVATECKDEELQQKMFDTCPVLYRIYPDSREHFLLFRVKVLNVEVK
ncbi:MAG: NimC/NimA family protein [Clostridiales bacterium]|nr:NimC/NimA family protein [Clostridiales bacterium]